MTREERDEIILKACDMLNTASVKEVASYFNVTTATIRNWKNESNKKSRVLVISDTHIPYELEGTLDWYKYIYKKWNCNKVIHIGDFLDFHAMSFHKSDPSLPSAGDEWKTAKEEILKWVEAFPEMMHIVGNHSALPYRQALACGIPKEMVVDMPTLFNAPGWEFGREFVVDNVLYMHGESGQARTVMRKRACSVVQGHRHFELGVEYMQLQRSKIFGMQVGCTVDRESLAMRYARNYQPQNIGCGIVINGKEAYPIPAEISNGRIYSEAQNDT